MLLPSFGASKDVTFSSLNALMLRSTSRLAAALFSRNTVPFVSGVNPSFKNVFPVAR